MDLLDSLISDAQRAFAAATQPAALENEKAHFLGKGGSLTELLKGLSRLDPEERRSQGARINAAKARDSSEFATAYPALKSQSILCSSNESLNQ